MLLFIRPPEPETAVPVKGGRKRKVAASKKPSKKKKKDDYRPNMLDMTWIHPESYPVAER